MKGGIGASGGAGLLCCGIPKLGGDGAPVEETVREAKVQLAVGRVGVAGTAREDVGHGHEDKDCGHRYQRDVLASRHGVSEEPLVSLVGGVVLDS